MRQRKMRKNVLPCVGWPGLASAIIQQAIKDYKSFDTSLIELARIRDFFKSKWFQFLCGMDGEDILLRLDKYREGRGCVDIRGVLRTGRLNGRNVGIFKRLDDDRD